MEGKNEELRFFNKNFTYKVLSKSSEIFDGIEETEELPSEMCNLSAKVKEMSNEISRLKSRDGYRDLTGKICELETYKSVLIENIKIARDETKKVKKEFKENSWSWSNFHISYLDRHIEEKKQLKKEIEELRIFNENLTDKCSELRNKVLSQTKVRQLELDKKVLNENIDILRRDLKRYKLKLYFHSYDNSKELQDLKNQKLSAC